MVKCEPRPKRREARLAGSLLESLTERHCPICGGEQAVRTFAEANLDAGKLDSFAFASRKIPEFMHYRLVECQGCDLVYASPTPSADFLGNAYDEAQFDSNVEAEYASRTYANVIARILKRLPDLRGALDIGTGDGCFLEKLIALGFTEVEGVEPSTAPIRAAKPEIRPLIRHDVFEADSFTPGTLSLVTCFQTIEHVSEPAKMVNAIHTLLKPGGAVVLICHNRRGAVNTLLGAKSPIRDIEHLQLFSPRSVTQMLQNAGFVDVQVSSIVNKYPMSYWLKLLPIPLGMKSGLTKFVSSIGLGSLALPMPVGNLAAIGFRR